VEMAVVKIIHVAVMANRGVPAILAMLMGVIGMMLLGAGHHDCVLSSFRNLSGPLVSVCRLLANWQLGKGRSCSRNLAALRSEDGTNRKCRRGRCMSVVG